ncbi:MAG: tyrosine-type recombinase/integrase [Drouetiella hepatica Uher 2000/2452]|jgi:integrase|uniref:Tyrosine-type recombinase/integrase n=1 Tax=Drouetiella hepatica Uher 2000/2452 TaxID=904376 RepID=A0A951QEG6_9CYAN|nr:tyrosine-type recombinase/integrase [Drouetiella hepatica Uher 2000/2452]
MGKKSQHGTVAISPYKDRLRLRWSYQGNRYCLSLELPDTQVNRVVARGKASIIEGDLVTGNFDKTLTKYRPQQQQASSNLSIAELLRRFTEYKRRNLYARSLDKFKALHKPITEFFSGKSAASIDEESADNFRIFLAQRLSPATQRERLTTLSACWKWGLKQKLVTQNPWTESLKRVKVPPSQKPKPFTSQEIQAILTEFRGDRYYAHYADFVEFLLSTGCRIGEAIALRWGHLEDDCSKVWIGESISRGGIRKTTKTNRARRFRLTPRLRQMLLDRCPVNCLADALVFPAPKGGVIDDHRFCNRAWQKIIAKAGVKHRHPYNCRHTFISHALARGIAPMTIAEMVGHDPEVLFKHYAADIQGGLQLPDILDDPM